VPGSLVRLAVLTVTNIAFARVVWVVSGFLRSQLRRSSTVASRWGWVELFTLPEPFVLAAVTYALFASDAPSDVRFPQAIGAIAGAVIAVAAVALTGWAFLSLPSVGSGHYVLRDQPIIDRGAYGWLRHPIYVGAFFIWLALAMAYWRLLPLVVLALYVVPIYLLYIREEERFMVERYGEAYEDYRRRVGGLLPRVRS
jgi:protein-S-isoprenylcysteine O-methyltransferase Ste14